MVLLLIMALGNVSFDVKIDPEDSKTLIGLCGEWAVMVDKQDKIQETIDTFVDLNKPFFLTLFPTAEDYLNCRGAFRTTFSQILKKKEIAVLNEYGTIKSKRHRTVSDKEVAKKYKTVDQKLRRWYDRLGSAIYTAVDYNQILKNTSKSKRSLDENDEKEAIDKKISKFRATMFADHGIDIDVTIKSERNPVPLPVGKKKTIPLPEEEETDDYMEDSTGEA